MTRVALVSSSFHPYPGGVEEHVREVAIALRERGHEPVVWTVDRGERLGTGVVDGIPVRWLPTPLPAGRPGAMGRFVRAVPGAVRAWLAACAADRPDVLHVHCFGPNGLYAVLLHHVRGLPLVVSGHGETIADPAVFDGSAQLRWGLRRAVREAQAVTACSAVALGDLRTRFGLRGGQVVPNGIRADAAVPVHGDYREVRVGSDRTVTIAAVGRLEPVKGFDLLVQAMGPIRERLPGAVLRLGGSGSQAAALAQLARERGLGDAVRLLGRLDGAAVARELAEADVVVLPSRREAFGLVVLEAWRSGSPLVATDRDGPGELVQPGVTGLLADPTDPAGLAAAVVSIVTDAELAQRLGAAGRVAAQRFSWDAVAAAYERCYALSPPTRASGRRRR